MVLLIRKISLIQIKSYTKVDFYDFLIALSSGLHSSQSHQPRPSLTRWLKPPCDKIKVNWGTAFMQKEEIIGVRVIARNH